MLTKLLPDQISNFWDVIKYSVEGSLPPIVGDHPDRMNRILSSLLCGKSECWASYNRQDKGIKFEGIVLTKMIYDDASDTRNLLIYCLYGYEDVNKESWLDGIKALTKYAKSKKCNQIIAYTEYGYLVNIAKSLGGNAKHTLVTFDVNETVAKLNGLEI
jgi:hypothetical protein